MSSAFGWSAIKSARARTLGHNGLMMQVRPSAVAEENPSRVDAIGEPPEWDFYMPRTDFHPWTSGRETVAYQTFYNVVDRHAQAMLRVALRRWVDEDLELSAALRWAATYSPRIEFLLDAEWEAGRLSGQGGYVVTVRFNDRSFARTRVADARSPLVPRRLSVDLYLTTTHLHLLKPTLTRQRWPRL